MFMADEPRSCNIFHFYIGIQLPIRRLVYKKNWTHKSGDLWKKKFPSIQSNVWLLKNSHNIDSFQKNGASIEVNYTSSLQKLAMECVVHREDARALGEVCFLANWWFPFLLGVLAGVACCLLPLLPAVLMLCGHINRTLSQLMAVREKRSQPNSNRGVNC
ncbi:unnamed protein product [Cylicocyclus nassatus]|uniref:Uncharacterized protein n=1 Tax=Cylicocyclus nassatus TaxID=53992 RepID=A0AA36HA50_CYLNA|nr:unnamed protein product [Cylicocyclus nassatus]